MILAIALSIALGISSGPQTIRLEAENAELLGATVTHERPGYSGTGYVTGLTETNSHIVWKFTGKSGIYSVRLGYSASGPKGTTVVVNGISQDAMLDPTGNHFGVADLGKIELKSGENTLQINRGWGYYDVDYAELIPARADAPPPLPTEKLCDPLATRETVKLYQSLRKAYGKSTLSGQYGKSDTDRVQRVAGVKPMIYGTDLIEYTPSRVERGAKGTTVEDAIAAFRSGQIVTYCWHWNAPTDLIDKMEKDSTGKEMDHRWYRGFYTDSTTFDFSKALADPGSPNYQLMIRDIDAIAVQLKRLDALGIPILWRPLHEAEGGWFWWGARGPEAYIKLWKLMYDRLTNVHHLHNLIWVYSSGTNPAWYPGDEYVDIVGIDAYPSSKEDTLSSTWELLSKRFARRKLLAISEFGGIPDVARMRKFGIDWSYFATWNGFLGGLTDAQIKSLYTTPQVVSHGG